MKTTRRTAVETYAILLFGVALVGAPPWAGAAVNMNLVDVPDYDWVYGCMGTASGNLAGFWDRHGFPDFYTGGVNGGVAPLTAANADITALWASKAGVDGRPSGSPGHVDDYYVEFESTAPDPWLAAGRTEHAPDCIADFIGMNQFKWPNLRNECQGNIDGYCFVSWNPSGDKRENHVPDPASAEPEIDVQTGLRSWAQWRGYDADVFTQLTDFNPYTPAGKGFTFADLKAEIDAGYPVLLFLQNFYQKSQALGDMGNVNPPIHAMLAYGYYISGGVDYVRYRTSWASGNNKLRAWNAQPWEVDLPVRGVIGFHPLPRIRRFSLDQGNLTLGWDGPASDLRDAVLGTTNRVHGYVLELSTNCATADFEAVSPMVLTNTFTVTNCPSPAFLRLRLVRPPA